MHHFEISSKDNRNVYETFLHLANKIDRSLFTDDDDLIHRTNNTGLNESVNRNRSSSIIIGVNG